MVLICGADVVVDELPLADSIEYKIISKDEIAVALKTKARQQSCVTIYLKSDLRSYLKGVPVSVTDKTVLFDTKEELIEFINRANSSTVKVQPKKEEKYESITSVLGGNSHQNNGITSAVEDVSSISLNKTDNTHTADIQNKPVVESVESVPLNNGNITSIEGQQTMGTQNKQTVANVESVADNVNTEIGVSEVTEVDVSLPDIFNCEPYDDNDSLKVKLKGKEEQLSQAYAMLEEARNTIDRAYEEQAKAVNDVKTVYDNKLVEAQNVIQTLKDKIFELQHSSGKYEIYSSHPNALLQEGFSKEEKSVIGSLNMNLQVLFNGTDIYRMYDTVKKTVQFAKEGYVFVDLVGDYIMSRTYKSKDTSMSSLNLLGKLSDSDIETVRECAVDVGTSKVITCKPYHDIKLLDVDWGTALTNISKAFPNRKIVMIFGSIQSFAVEYTVSKFATMFNTTVFVKCSPFGINFVYGKMRFIPNGRGIKWMVSDYYDGAKTLLNKIGTEYSVKSSVDLMSLDDMV